MADGPLEHPNRADPPAAQIPDHCAHAGNSGTPMMGDPGLEPGTSSLSGKPFVASSPLDSHLIPANRCDGASGRGLEGTGGDKLVAPSWPHGRNSRAQCRMTRKPTSRRRYGQTRTLRRRARCAPAGSRRPRRASVLVELVHHVTVGVEGEPATVTELGRDIQTSARHAASTASLDSRSRRRRGCGATGGAEGDLVASQLLRASRETRGERPT
jgi:hypothetical protein